MPTIIDEAILYKDAIVIVLALTSATANFFFSSQIHGSCISIQQFDRGGDNFCRTECNNNLTCKVILWIEPAASSVVATHTFVSQCPRV